MPYELTPNGTGNLGCPNWGLSQLSGNKRNLMVRYSYKCLLMLFSYKRKKRYPIATKMKIIAPGDFLEITPSGAMVCGELCALQEQFQRCRCLAYGEIVGLVIPEGRQW